MKRGWMALVALTVWGCSGTSIYSPKRPDVVAMRKDAELAEAVKRAQARLPDFLERLQRPKPGERFAVQVRFRSDSSFEHMWVDHLSFDGTLIHGKLADQPLAIKSLRKGDSVSMETSQVMDWLILGDGQREGGFAEAVLKAKQGK